MTKAEELVADAAVRRKLISIEQLGECYMVQSRGPAGKEEPIGQILVKRGFLSPTQLKLLLDEYAPREESRLPPSGLAEEAHILRACLRDEALNEADTVKALKIYFGGSSSRKFSEILAEEEFVAQGKLDSHKPKPLATEERQIRRRDTVRSRVRPPATRRQLPRVISRRGTLAAGAAALAAIGAIALLFWPTTAPVALIERVEPRILPPGSELSLSARVEGGRAPFHYTWGFEGPSPFAFETSEARSSYRPPKAGSYLVTLEVKDCKGRRAKARASDITVEVAGILSVKILRDPPGGIAPLEVSLEAKAEGGVEPLHFEWQAPLDQRAQGPRTRVKLRSPGQHRVTLTVTDGSGQKTTATAEVALQDLSASVAAISLPYYGSEGSGFFLDNKGETIVMTNEHVANGPGPIYVIPFEERMDRANQRRIRAQVAAVHPEMDLVALRLASPAGRPPLRIAAAPPAINEKLRIVGNSGGFSLLSREGTAGQYDAQTKLFNFSATVNPGDSGSAVFSEDAGEVVGVVVRRYEWTGGHRVVQGHAEAIPPTFVRETVAALAATPLPMFSQMARNQVQTLRATMSTVFDKAAALRQKIGRPGSGASIASETRKQYGELAAEGQKPLTDFVADSRKFLAREGAASEWGQALWQARCLARAAVERQMSASEFCGILVVLRSFCDAASRSTGPCGLCAGKGYVICPACEGSGGCPRCGTSSRPDCEWCAGTGKCLRCLKVGNFPCLLCGGKRAWSG